MSYQEKYLKYKKKYKKLQNQIGGNLINLSGPVTIDYYKNIELNKKIIILGDIHNSESGICINEGVNIITYMNNIFKSDVKIDFFIELDVPEKYQLINGLRKTELINSAPDFITKLIEFSIDNYKKDSRKRIHFTDIRNKIVGHEAFVYFEEVLNLLNNVTNFNDDINLLDFYNNYNNGINNLLYVFFNYMNNYNNEKLQENIFLPRRLVKEINKTKPEILNLLFNVTIKYIDDYLSVAFNEDLIIDLNNKNILFDLYDKCRLALTSLNDLYTILKIINDDDINNIIIYVGVAHTKIYLEYLNAINIILFKHKESTNNNIRCIKDVDEFISFFNI